MSKTPELTNQKKTYTNIDEIIVGLVRKDKDGSKFFESFFSINVKKTDFHYLTLVEDELVMTKIPPDTLKPGRLIKFKNNLSEKEKQFLNTNFKKIKEYLCSQNNY